MRFVEPIYFQLFNLVGLMGLCLVVVILLKLYLRPPRSKHSRYRLLGRDWALALAVLLGLVMVTALAGPRINSGYDLSQAGSIDVLIFVDNSASMAAKDLLPSRQEIAKRAARSLVEKRILKSGDRVTVFVFGGVARWRLPLSEDLEDFLVKLEEINQPAVYQEEIQLDTDFSYLLNYAAKSLATQDDFSQNNRWNLNLKQYHNSRIAFLFSDGNDESESSLETGLRELAKQKVKIYSLGVASKAGTTLTLKAYDPKDYAKTEKITFKTALQMKALEKIAQATGGETFILDTENKLAQAETFMRQAVEENRSTLPTLIYSERARDIWWEVLAVPSILLFLLMIILI